MKIAKFEIYSEVSFCLKVTTERDNYGNPLFLLPSQGIVTVQTILPTTKLIGEVTAVFKTI